MCQALGLLGDVLVNCTARSYARAVLPRLSACTMRQDIGFFSSSSGATSDAEAEAEALGTGPVDEAEALGSVAPAVLGSELEVVVAALEVVVAASLVVAVVAVVLVVSDVPTGVGDGGEARIA